MIRDLLNSPTDGHKVTGNKSNLTNINSTYRPANTPQQALAANTIKSNQPVVGSPFRATASGTSSIAANTGIGDVNTGVIQKITNNCGW